jgi:ferredoxin
MAVPSQANPTQAAFTIVYNQGTQKYELEQTLQPDEQMWIDIGKLIRENVPDKSGKTLPADLSAGSYDIRDLTNHGIGSLFEGKVIYDKTYGHVTYGCGVCCGYQPPVFWWDPLGISFLGTADNGVDAYDTCDDDDEDVSGSFYGNWTTANSAIATVDTYGTHTGKGIGSTTSSTHG